MPDKTLRPNEYRGTRAFTNHAGNPRFNAEQVDIGHSDPDSPAK